MEKIYQGSNNPLLLEVVGLENLEKISAVLIQYGVTKKEWDINTVNIQEGVLVLPLSERDTLKLTRGLVVLDIKGYTKDKRVEFMDIVEYRVIERNNKNTFEEV